MVLNNATNILLGQIAAQAVYSRQEMVWPSGGGGIDSYVYDTLYNGNTPPEPISHRAVYYTGDKTNPTVPAQYDNVDVLVVCATAFNNKISITSATIESGITEIE